MDMNLLKKYFPFSFRKKPETKELIIDILIYVIAGAIAGAVIGVLGQIKLIGWIFKIVGGVAELYVIAGIVLTVLDYKNLLK